MSQQVVVQLETWRNPGQARVVIKRFDGRGEPNRDELIRGGATFTLTPQEREVNQRLAYNPDLDLFSNGTLVPVDLIEGSEAALAAARNPNLLSDDDMRGMVVRRGPASTKAKADEAFGERLAAIQNATTLGRLLALAEEEDAPVSRVRAIQRRLAEVEGLGLTAPAPIVDERATANGARPGALRPVTPG